MLLVIFLTGAILWNLPLSKYDNVVYASQVEPGYLDFDNLPDTNFSCEGKVIGGYYADIETGCQMFHVCTIGQKSEITDIKFLCLNGTVFDQETRVCERLDEVDCSKSESFFDLNLELYGNNGGGYGIQPEDENKDSSINENCEEEYEDGDTTCKTKSDKDSKQKDEEYSDWEESTTSPAPPLRISSTTVPTSTAKPTISTSTRSPLSTPQKFNFQSLKDIQVPVTTQNPSLQLLALHESFQENLKNRDAQKLRSSSPVSHKAPPPPAVSTYQLQNPVQIHPSPFAPLPNKLPNTVSNLSQKTHFPTPLANANRTPSSPQPVIYKSEPQQSNFYIKQHSQKVTPKQSLPTPTPVKHPAVDTSILYRYNILSANGASRSDPFTSSIRYSVQPSPTTPSQTFKMESVHVNPLTHSAFTVAQARPYTYDPKTQRFITAKEPLNEPDEEDEDIEEEAEDETVLPIKHAQLQQKFDNFNPHMTFARAIPEAKNNSNAAVSVVQSTSSVSSSISSKPHSAISNISVPASLNTPVKTSLISANKAGANSFATTLLDTTSNRIKVNAANITEINEQLTEEQPAYYEEASADYGESSQEYKDILYPTDVQKIKQR